MKHDRDKSKKNLKIKETANAPLSPILLKDKSKCCTVPVCCLETRVPVETEAWQFLTPITTDLESVALFCNFWNWDPTCMDCVLFIDSLNCTDPRVLREREGKLVSFTSENSITGLLWDDLVCWLEPLRWKSCMLSWGKSIGVTGEGDDDAGEWETDFVELVFVLFNFLSSLKWVENGSTKEFTVLNESPVKAAAKEHIWIIN